MKVTVGVSNRHVHLDEKTYSLLFKDRPLEKRNELNQVGEFASTSTVDIIYKDKKIEHVRVVGPLRKQNQIELLKSDLDYLGLEAPVRRSGDLKDTPSIILKSDLEEVSSSGVIRAERHVHVPTSLEDELDLHERDIVKLSGPNCTFYANVKVSDNGYYELHIDKDEAEEYGLTSGEEIELSKCGE